MRAFLFVISIISVLATCKSAQDKFKDKNYTGAFDEALKDLKKGKDKNQNLAIVKKSLHKIVASYKDLYANYPSMTDPDKRAKVADSNIDLTERINKAKSYIVPDSFFNQQELAHQNQKLKKEVGNVYFSRAQTLLSEIKSTRKKSTAPQAIKDIEKAQKYIGVTPETTKCIDEIVQYGTVVINVEVDQWGMGFSNYEIDRLFRKVEKSSSKQKLITLMYDSNKAKNQIDCNVEVRLSSIDYEESTEKHSQTFTEKIPDGFEIIKDDKGNDIKVQKYKNVSGDVEKIKYILKASCDARTEIDDYEGNCTWSENRWSSSVETYREEYKLSGDERAIPSEYKTQPSNNMKSKSTLADEILEDLYNDFARKYL